MNKIKALILQHPVRVQLLFWILFVFGFAGVSKYITEPVIMMHCFLDDWIPFVKYAVLVYALWFPYILVSLVWFVLYGEEKEFWRLSLGIMLGMVGCLVFYVLVPNGLAFRPTVVEGNDIFAWGVRTVWKFDTPQNVCPSIHVMVSLLIDLSVTKSGSFKKAGKPVKIASNILCVLIILSTMLLKQHSVIDVIAGGTTAWVIYSLMNRWIPEENESSL